MRLLLGNFDLEHHLSPAGARTLPAAVQRLNAELAFSLVAVAQPGDFLWSAAAPEPEYFSHLASIGLPEVRIVSDRSEVPASTELYPWGWSQSVRSWGTQNGWRCDGPGPAVVAMINARSFSTDLEQEWNCALPHACTVHSGDELHAAIAKLAHESAAWVVKANFGMSARERFLGRGAPTPQAIQWVRKQIAESGAVYFEPWVERLEEVGLQFTIPLGGEPVLEGITPLHTDAVGTYRGSQLRGTSCQLVRDKASAFVIKIATQAACRIQQLGYFGPLGIDAMRYRTSEDEIRWRPLQDINARLTMGRLALALARLVQSGDHASWLHVRWPNASDQINECLTRITHSLPKGTCTLRTSPLTVAGRPTSRGTLLIIAPSAETLVVGERIVTETCASLCH